MTLLTLAIFFNFFYLPLSNVALLPIFHHRRHCHFCLIAKPFDLWWNMHVLVCIHTCTSGIKIERSIWQIFAYNFAFWRTLVGTHAYMCAVRRPHPNVEVMFVVSSFILLHKSFYTNEIRAKKAISSSRNATPKMPKAKAAHCRWVGMAWRSVAVI